MRKDIMVDIETLGNQTESTIFQIAAVSFDITTGEIHSEFNKIANIEENSIMEVTGSTLKWWLNTNKELLTDLLNKGEGSSEELLTDFHEWLKKQGSEKELHFWGNGILFDNKMIQHQFNESGLDYPIFYRNDRDVRTIVDLACTKLGVTEKELKGQYNDDSLVLHDAFDDVKYQVRIVTGCYRELIG